MSVLTHVKRDKKKTPFTSGIIVNTSLHGNKQPQHWINTTFPFPTVLVWTFHIIHWRTWKQNSYCCSNHTDHYVLHVKVSWTIWAMPVITNHIHSSEFKSLSHMLNYSQHSRLAEPRLQHIHGQVAHRRASSWTELLGVLIVCMDMADIVIHAPFLANQLSTHPFSGSRPSQLQKKQSLSSHSCIT